MRAVKVDRLTEWTNKIILGDCLELIKELSNDCVDFVLTDPPYPDQHTDEYCYYEGIIDFLNDLKCRQLIFWSAKVDFPLDYTAIHIWDKATGCYSQYERIFERNGNKEYKIFRYMPPADAGESTNDG